jgi:hypothetical protein
MWHPEAGGDRIGRACKKQLRATATALNAAIGFVPVGLQTFIKDHIMPVFGESGSVEPIACHYAHATLRPLTCRGFRSLPG